ncbi:thiol-disulfide oxidoreductase DCC family protein [Pedobacter sp. MW01-1-1]|uniref:thiol-disulfide oxidoreductase DCC family protein n=1 Tax=Pedobacter sp. MW01-1-1 TaxID=3383027 RepID=UPI003FEF33B8
MFERESIIFFDGVCNLCNASVQFVIERDRKNTFKFSALQGELAKEVLPKFAIDIRKLDSIVLLEGGKCFTESTAALRIAKQLSGAWPLLYVFIIVPSFVRNPVYRFIANNRYKWWGKQESCWVPTPALKNRFYS